MKFFFIIGNFFDVSGVIIADSQQDKKQKKLHIMNTVLSLFTAFTFALNGFAQGFSQSGDISDDMIPEDWEYLGSATGDLNNDGRADLFVVARPPKAANQSRRCIGTSATSVGLSTSNTTMLSATQPKCITRRNTTSQSRTTAHLQLDFTTRKTLIWIY